ncbi:unnamed protein product [Rotaria sp. Silwood1]|nr:unnamed protein product [Rotaria sp. Silwood1]CAF1619207.1 unnamed protein product [Rotaria sp. Silwood1]CAF3697850.1 unnamed protein product [Rotaria sp. Silwood1]CAF3764455.1 unnamed protein product [Rotaria sp. Silwood1]CAF4838627.1 unnamed protein product [Rotaria sp. Silwood1]
MTVNEQLKEKWMVMIVKHPLLRSLLVDDIEFKKTSTQIKQELIDKEKREDDESVKQCPKCQQNYIPCQANHGSCHYHDGYVYYLDESRELSDNEANMITQDAKMAAQIANSDQKFKPPRLIWACCLRLYGQEQPCRVGICGLPDDLKDQPIPPGKDLRTFVEEHFKTNPLAKKNIEQFKKISKHMSTTTTSQLNPVPNRPTTTMFSSKKP